MMKSFLLAVLLFALAVTAQTGCGPPQCYYPCTNSKPIVDLVFMIDVSGSMANPIQGVKNGLTTFVQNLSTNISPTFSLVIFGANSQNGLCWLDINAVTSATTFINRMAYWVSHTGGGVEPGLETFRCALNIASANNLNINYNTGQNSQKVLIMVTNEDSDPPVSKQNDNFNGNSQNQNWLNDYCYLSGVTNYPCNFNGITGANQIPPNTWTAAWQAEVDVVANYLIANSIPVYMFVAGSQSIGVGSSCNQKDVLPTQTCNTHYQYCNPDGQTQSATDYSNFDAAATYSTMVSKGEQGCLQGQVLHAGGTMRCFDVYATGNSQLVTSFFQQITADLSKCHTDCFDYICSSPTTCLPPVNQCGCDGVKYSGKVYDGHGGCCWANQTDCAGYCAGTHSYDNCGVCVLTSSPTDTLCKQDCAHNYYLTGAPTTNYIIPSSYHFDAAGYLLENADIENLYINTWKNVASISQQFHDTGMFQSRSYCTFDLNYYNNRYGTNYGQSDAETNWLASLLTSSPRSAQCVAGSLRRYPPLSVDACGQCISDPTNPPYCAKDCTGTLRTSAASAYFYDNCGVCVPPGTDPNTGKDFCGVCGGNNATLNQCGVCGGTKALDSCNQPVCKALNCSTDCAGKFPIAHYVNNCGTCVAIGQTDSKCVKDCNDIYYNNTNTPPNHIDECGNCIAAGIIRLPTCVQDCSGKWNGTAYYDACGQCVINGVAPHLCLQDCSGAYYTSNTSPTHFVDSCGICSTAATANQLVDKCGICTNKLGYNSATDCTPDCKQVWSLTTSNNRAFVDACGSCWFANQTSMTNYDLDACGNCCVGGPANHTCYNVGSGTTDSYGNLCKCGQTPVLCSDGSTTCADSCPTYCPNTTNTKPDNCGLCPGNPYYGKTDECGVCCDPTITPNTCNTEKDACGVCFGFNASLNNPCHICDPTGKLCVKDCNGVYGGKSKVGCNGVCGFTGTCAVCGDGKVESPETCDLGSKKGVSLNVKGSGCNNCQTESGNAVGAAIGGAIGGVAAIVALGVAAFFALRYAQKAGLIGNANKQVDFGASNSNPLYKSEVSVHQNPLYDN